jgi:hypothetical protein
MVATKDLILASLKPSENYIVYDFPEKTSQSDINCSYSYNHYTILKNSVPRKDYIKEIAFERFILGLTQQGTIELGLLSANGQIEYDKHVNFFENELENSVVKIFFIQQDFTLNTGYIFIITDDELITYEYALYFTTGDIDLKTLGDVESNAILDNKDNINNIFYTRGDYLVFLDNGFYFLTRDEADSWEELFFNEIEIEGEKITLKDISVIIESPFFCISVKGYGLIFFYIYSNEISIKQTFKHEHIISLVSSKITENIFNVGVIIDNETDANVKEFFFELAINIENPLSPSEFYLNRVFITSQKVKSFQTDYQGLISMFLIGTNVYIIPRSVSQVNTLPIYIYKASDEYESLGFLYVNTKDIKAITFRLKGQSNDNGIVTLYKKSVDSFSCRFKKEGRYVVKVSKRCYDLLENSLVPKVYMYSVGVGELGNKNRTKMKNKEAAP